MNREELNALNDRLAGSLGWLHVAGGQGINPDEVSPGSRWGVLRSLPDYAGTWEGMGEVVAALQARNLAALSLEWGNDGRWDASLRFEPGERYAEATGETAPMAVALAALRALETPAP